MSGQNQSRISEVAAPIIEKSGLYLESVSLTPAGKRTRVVVVVDADTDEALDLDRVAEVSREISQGLEDLDVISGAYVLEVTSPGVERSLTLPRHWRRANGRLVKVRLLDESEVVGRVLQSDDTAVNLEVDSDRLEIPLNEIVRANVEIEFNRK